MERNSTASSSTPHPHDARSMPSSDQPTWWKNAILKFLQLFSFIQSVLIQTLKQLWDLNDDSSVAMTRLFICAKDHFD